MNLEIRELLEKVKSGEISIDDASLALKKAPFVDIEYAKVDMHRKLRQGISEVIYGAGKSPEQIEGIVKVMLENDQDRILITRIESEKNDKISELLCVEEAGIVNYKGRETKYTYYENGRIILIGDMPEPNGNGKVLVATGGTSDVPVAEEAALTAEAFGNEVLRLYDVGVAGLHRLLPHMDEIMNANVIIAIAGMEGALASVIGGMSDCPVIAVPTSVGYGAAFEGLAALLSMLNSCASGVSVVNIDNGFGAGFLASRINHMTTK